MVKNCWMLVIITGILFLTLSVSAESINITKNISINLGNGAYIKITAPQKVSHITIWNSSDTPASTVQFLINDTQIRYTANTNKTIFNISYNNITDTANYYGEGTNGYLVIDIKMKNTTANYTLKVDSVEYNTNLSNSQGWVRYNYSAWSQHYFEIIPTITIIIETGGNETTLTFTDVTCLNIGSLCKSEIQVYRDGNLTGTLASTDDYLRISNASSIKIVLNPSMATVLSYPQETQRNIASSWTIIFAALFLFGIAVAGYYSVKKMLSKR